MSKIKLYFSTLLVCISIFIFLQALSMFATIIFQIVSIFIIGYGIIGAQLWIKKGDNNGKI